MAWLTAPASGAVHILLYLGVLFLGGQFGGRVANYFRLPRVTGYLLAGILLGPSLSGSLPAPVVDDLSLVTHIALAIIAFSIGGTLELKSIKRLGKSISVVTVGEAVMAMVAVTGSLWLVSRWLIDSPTSPQDIVMTALVVGAMCAATAPAAVLSVVREYRAHGPLTTVLLGVVALDDACAILLFAVAINLAAGIHGGEFVWNQLLLESFGKIALSVLAGGAAGLFLYGLMRWFPRSGNLLGLVLGTLFVAAGACLSLGASPLLAAMMFGFVVANFVRNGQDAFHVVDQIEEPIFGLFFCLAGAHLNLSLLWVAGGLALVITLARLAGKMFGAAIGARLSGAPAVVTKYLGLALLPQAGVTVGLVLEAQERMENGLMDTLFTAVLAAVVINELLTPLAIRYALFAAGEAQRKRGPETVED